MAGILQTLIGSLAGAIKDTFFEYVTLLLPGNGTNGAQNNTFTDASTNNFTITRNGNTTQGTFSPYGSNWSNYFDGTGDYLTVADNAAFALGSGDFTIEAWVLPTSTVATNSISNVCSQYVEGGSRSFLFALYNNAGTMQLLFQPVSGATETAISYNATFNVGEWVHIAAVRNGNNVTLYRNGTSLGTTAYSSAINDANNDYLIGCRYNAGVTPALFFTGYISNHRLVKGTAVYTANFTPPTAPLTAITNTSLLTCQSSRIIDNSTNAFAITKNGDVSVQRFSPFSPTAAYDAATIGGSGYFDGSGDYLSGPTNNAAFKFSTGDFTVEAWVYSTSFAAYQTIVDARVSNSAVPWALFIEVTSGKPYWYDASGTQLSSTGLTLNAWQHVAVARSGSTIKMFINGVQVYSGTNTNAQDATGVLYIGRNYDNDAPLVGYMSNFRVVKGTAVYTAGFTPPTAPLTAITNTQLLLNFTNAGIIDNSMLNDLETVGNAQISTAQSKFGGSSMLFDGTGDSLVCPFADRLTFGTGDFTIEYWLRTSATAASLLNPSTTGTGYWSNFINTSTFWWQSANQTTNLKSTSATAIIDGNWHHIAIVRASGTLNFYFDGTAQGSGTADSTNYSGTAGTLRIGGSGGYVSDLNGYIDDLRITKGVARYTANFTPPGSAFPTS